MRRRCTFADVRRAALPFIVVHFVATAILILFPQIALVLPDLLLGSSG